MKHEIIMDLLPLYHDGICSEQSRFAVEEHLKECEVCRKALEAMDVPLPEVSREAQEDKAVLRSLSKAWKKGKWKAIAKGAILAVLACVLLFGGWYLLTRVPLISLGAEEVRIYDVVQMKDRRLVFRLEAKDHKEIDAFDYDYIDGFLRITPKRTIIPGEYRDTMPWFEEGYCLIDIAEQNAWSEEHGDGTVTTAAFVGTDKDDVLLWKEGMQLPSASDGLEAFFGFEPGSAEYWEEREKVEKK